MTQSAKILRVGSQVVVDEDGVGLLIHQKFRRDLRGIPHSIGHAQAVGGQITKAAAIVTAARGNQAGSGQEALPRKNRSAGRRVLAIVSLVGGRVFRLQAALFHVRQDPRPKLHAIADGKRVRVRRTLFGAREDMQAAQHDLTSAAPVPLREFERSLGEGQMDGDAHHLRHGRKRRPPIEQILVPILELPVLRCRRREAGQRERWRQHVLPKTRVGVFRVEGIDQQRIARLYRSCERCGVEEGRLRHLGRAPSAPRRHHPRLVSSSHAVTLYHKVLAVKMNRFANCVRCSVTEPRP